MGKSNGLVFENCNFSNTECCHFCLTLVRGSIILVSHIFLSTVHKMCNLKLRSHLNPTYWYKLRKEAKENYSLDKVTVNGTTMTILIRYRYVKQNRQNDLHQIDTPSIHKRPYDLRQKTTEMYSTTKLKQANGNIQRNVAQSTILIRMDYEAKKN